MNCIMNRVLFITLIFLIQTILQGNGSPIEDVEAEGLQELEILGNEDYNTIGLNLLNNYRTKHGVEPLKLNKTLGSIAQSYAEYLSRTNTFQNKIEPGLIKNLYYYKGTPTLSTNSEAIKRAIENWYGTIRKYRWNNPDKPTPFSAMVWRSTTDVGFGLATKGIRTVVVSAFSPPGNILGDNGQHFKENVFRSL